MLPALRWLVGYRWRRDGPSDLIAGVTVAFMLVPQSMAYAALAGLPPEVGLYASVVPLLVYALLGTSRQLAVGPAAMDSLLVASSVGALAAGGSERYLLYAVLLAGMVGVVQVLLGVLRLGRVAKLLSYPVVAGFMSGAAILIALSQLPQLLGTPKLAGTRLHELMVSLGRHLGDVHVLTLALGATSVAILVWLKRRHRRLPGAMLVVAIATLSVWGLELEQRGVHVVGLVPPGLRGAAWPVFDAMDVVALAPASLAIALVAFTEAISVARVFADREGYAVDANQELVALGGANLAGFLFGAYPVTGGLGRSAVNAEAGAKTPMAGVITALLVAAALSFFTPLFTNLPRAALAAIVITAVAGLVDLRGLRRLWREDRGGALVFMITAIVTLEVGIVQGIAAGVVAAAVRTSVARWNARRLSRGGCRASSCGATRWSG